MDRRRFLASLAACPACASAALAQTATPHWEYDGARGATKWGELDSRFKACAVGSEQSPINLTNAIRARVDGLAIDWKPQAFDVVNNGHTIQANAKDGSSLRIGKSRDELKQFHFHTPSEHAFDGKRTAMEAHFVHAADDGRPLRPRGRRWTPRRRRRAHDGRTEAQGLLGNHAGSAQEGG